MTSVAHPDSGFNDFLWHGTVPVVGNGLRTRGHVFLGSRSEPQLEGSTREQGIEKYMVDYPSVSEPYTKLYSNVRACIGTAPHLLDALHGRDYFTE